MLDLVAIAQSSPGPIAVNADMTVRAVEGRLYRLKKQLRRMLGGEGHV